MISGSNPAVPQGLSLHATSEAMVICRRWFILATVPVTVFTVAWDTSMFFIYRSVFRTPDLTWPILLFPTGHLAVGLALTYGVLAMFINRTEVRISSSGLEVKRGPLPWIGDIALSRAELSEVFILPEWGDGSVSGYRVMSLDRAQKKRALLTGLSTIEQAEYVGATIRQRLGLPDPAV